MTRAEFWSDDGGLCGFLVRGHSSSDSEDEQGRLVCAAVSSAVYLAANTVIEVIGDRCETEVDDAAFRLRVIRASDASRSVLQGLRLHLEQLAEQYKNRVQVISEV